MRLKYEDLKEIARLVDEGYGSWTIARMYNYSKANMYMIVSRYKKHGLEGIIHSESKSFTIGEKIAVINRYMQVKAKRR